MKKAKSQNLTSAQRNSFHFKDDDKYDFDENDFIENNHTKTKKRERYDEQLGRTAIH